MYEGILETPFELESVLVEVDSAVKRESWWNKLIDVYGDDHIYKYQCLPIRSATELALENIAYHGSNHYKVRVGLREDNRMVIEVEDPDQGFDPAGITKFKRRGEGYKEYCATSGQVFHSPDGHFTYFVSPW